MISRKKFKKILDKDTSLAHDLKATFNHSANNWDIDAWLKYQELYPKQKSPRMRAVATLLVSSGVVSLIPAGLMTLATSSVALGAAVHIMATTVLCGILVADNPQISYSTKHDQTIKALRKFARGNRNTNPAI